MLAFVGAVMKGRRIIGVDAWRIHERHYHEFLALWASLAFCAMRTLLATRATALDRRRPCR